MTIRAIITGHSRGIGAALAEALLAQGVAVLGLARASNDELAERYPDLLSQAGLDLADSRVLARWLDESDMLLRFLAGAYQAILINNAGTLHPMGAPGLPQGHLQIAQAVSLNVTAPLMLTDAFVSLTSGVADRRVLHLSSGAGRAPYAGWSVYGATKAALDLHARAVQLDKVPGLRVASVAPGVVDTAMQAEIRGSSETAFPGKARFDALKRDGALADPQVVAQQMVRYLLSADFGQDPVADLRSLPR